MAHPNEQLYLQQFLDDYPVEEWAPAIRAARVLEVGSADVKHRIDYRALFPTLSVVGLDQQAGPGVDVVCDLTGDCAELGDERFGIILCCSVLEHCEQPWVMAEHLRNRLLPGGLLYVTVPWIWNYHAYPKDYWRFSIDGVRLLFPDIKWKRVNYVTQNPGEFLREGGNFKHLPWRSEALGRTMLVTQLVCMIGWKV